MSFGQRNLDREKPEIDFPQGDVPTELVITDLIEKNMVDVVVSTGAIISQDYYQVRGGIGLELAKLFADDGNGYCEECPLPERHAVHLAPTLPETPYAGTSGSPR